MSVAWADLREKLAQLSEVVEDWSGIPTPLDDLHLILEPTHPMRAIQPLAEAIMRGEWPSARPVPGPDQVEVNVAALVEQGGTVCRSDDEKWRIRNEWFSWGRQARVTLIEHEDRPGRVRALVEPVAPDRSMARLDLWLGTCGASYAWSLEAELKAREKLRTLIRDHLYAMYEMTGAFLEHSERSGITYLFRRARPTVAMRPWSRFTGGRLWPEEDNKAMRVLAVLCMHPIGYYAASWAGAMVPTDDVIAHLLHMRGDEARYWRLANQHEPASPNAGL